MATSLALKGRRLASPESPLRMRCLDLGSGSAFNPVCANRVAANRMREGLAGTSAPNNRAAHDDCWSRAAGLGCEPASRLLRANYDLCQKNVCEPHHVAMEVVSVVLV